MAKKILPVIMCGGAGTRVWPESRETMPKQFIALIGSRRHSRTRCCASPSGVRRADRHHQPRLSISGQGAARPRSAQGDDRDRAGAARFRAAPSPSPRSSRRRSDPETVSAVFAADHVVSTKPPVPRACAAAPAAAAEGFIVTLGVEPTRAGDRLRLHPSRRADRAGEARPRSRPSSKSPTAPPPSATSPTAICGIPAISSSAPTSCSRNSGLRAGDGERPRPRRSHGANRPRLPRPRRAKRSSRAEKVDRLRGDGAHRSARRWCPPTSAGPTSATGTRCGSCRERDARGNSIAAKAWRSTPTMCMIRSSDLLTAVVGVKDVIVVSTQDAVLVLARDHGDKVKQLVDALKREQAPRGDRAQAHLPAVGLLSVDRQRRAPSGQAHRRRRRASGSRCRSIFIAPSTGSWSGARRR